MPCTNLATADPLALVYVTDTAFRRRCRIQSLSDSSTFFATMDRKRDREPDKCMRCRRYISSGGIRCKVCERPVEELRREVATLKSASISGPK
jgi:hypothetical protein